MCRKWKKALSILSIVHQIPDPLELNQKQCAHTRLKTEAEKARRRQMGFGGAQGAASALGRQHHVKERARTRSQEAAF